MGDYIQRMQSLSGCISLVSVVLSWRISLLKKRRWTCGFDDIDLPRYPLREAVAFGDAKDSKL